MPHLINLAMFAVLAALALATAWETLQLRERLVRLLDTDPAHLCTPCRTLRNETLVVAGGGRLWVALYALSLSAGAPCVRLGRALRLIAQPPHGLCALSGTTAS